MAFSFVISILVSAFILYKVSDIIRRHQLDINSQRGLILSSGLVLLFIVTNLTMPYPQSLYWFIFLAVVFIGSIFSHKVIRKEYTRFMGLKRKDMAINVVFYSLLIVTFHIYI